MQGPREATGEDAAIWHPDPELPRRARRASRFVNPVTPRGARYRGCEGSATPHSPPARPRPQEPSLSSDARLTTPSRGRSALASLSGSVCALTPPASSRWPQTCGKTTAANGVPKEGGAGSPEAGWLQFLGACLLFVKETTRSENRPPSRALSGADPCF